MKPGYKIHEGAKKTNAAVVVMDNDTAINQVAYWLSPRRKTKLISKQTVAVFRIKYKSFKSNTVINGTEQRIADHG